MLFNNFLAASRKVNLPGWLFANNEDTGWIGGRPTNSLPVYLDVTYAGVMLFDAAQAGVLTVTLTGDVISSSITYMLGTAPTGTELVLRVVQDSVGGHLFSLPPNMLADQGFAVDPRPNMCTSMFMMWNGAKWEPLAPYESFHV